MRRDVEGIKQRQKKKKDWESFMNLYVAGENEDRIVQISDKMN